MSTVYREHVQPAADGLRLYTRVYEPAGGAAHSVLCLHGLTRNSRDFEDLALHLAPSYRIVVPDLRGRGRSDWDPDMANYKPEVYLGDLLGVMAALSVTRTAVIGTSLGGLLAMMLAATQPALVSGVVLNDIGPEVDPTGAARIRDYAGRLAPVRTWGEAVAQLQSVFGPAWPGLSAERWMTLARRSYSVDATGAPRLDADPLIGEAMRATPPTTPASNLWPLWALLKETPVLCLRGGSSDILSTATLERMQREKPDLRAVTVANRGHVPLLDEPECLRAIDDFLATVQRRSATAAHAVTTERNT
jgi:pimeloyl-ACP methyl ester carboxylesterase